MEILSVEILLEKFYCGSSIVLLWRTFAAEVLLEKKCWRKFSAEALLENICCRSFSGENIPH